MNDETMQWAYEILGTCYGLDEMIEAYDLTIDIEDLEEKLANMNIEMCQSCGWWFESFELVPDDDEPEELTGHCYECRKDMAR